MATTWCCLLLLVSLSSAEEEKLVLDLVRTVACTGRTRVPSDYDLGPLLKLKNEDATVQRLLKQGAVSDDEFSELRRARAVWVLCAMLDHPRFEVQARAAEELAAIADPRTAPMLWLHGRRHYRAYQEGSQKAKLRAALTSAQQAIGMEPLPKGFDFLVRRWLTPTTVPQAMKTADAIQRAVAAGQEISWEEIQRRIPPAKAPIAGNRNWRWYAVNDDWILSRHFIHGPRTIRLEPRLPEATRWGAMPTVQLARRPGPEEEAQIARLVQQLNNPNYRALTAPDLPTAWSGPRIPKRAAVWDLLPHGGKIAHVLIPQLTRLDPEGEYAGRYVLRRVLSPGLRGATEILDDRRSGGAHKTRAWAAWLDLVGAGIPRGGLAIRLRGSRRLENGDVELDYVIGWFGNWSTSLPFADIRPVVTVFAEQIDGRRANFRAQERYATHRSSLHFDPHGLLFGRFLVPADRRIVSARVRLSLPPAPAGLRGIWSGTIESNTVDVGK